MGTSSTYRSLHVRQRHENRRRANPWRTQTAPRRSLGPRPQPEEEYDIATKRDTSQTGCIELPQNPSSAAISPGDVVALLTLLAAACTVLSATVYGAHHLLSELSSYSTFDVLRMFGGMP